MEKKKHCCVNNLVYLNILGTDKASFCTVAHTYLAYMLGSLLALIQPSSRF